MGGLNETTINGLRLHTNNGEVHIHDDKRQLKFSASLDNFKEDVEDALKNLEKSEGSIKITGNTSNDLYLIKEGKKLNVFLVNKHDALYEFQSFINKI